MIQAVIFDVDGTLVDSVDYHAEAWQRTFHHFGREVPFHEVRAQVGKGADQLLPVFWSRSELEELAKPINEFRAELFQREYLARVTGFPKVRELFLLLQGHGKQIALASSAQGDELDAYKRAAQITDLVEKQTAKDDVEKSKPHADIFEAALRQLGDPPPERVLVVGDTPWDIEAASRARLRTIGMRCGGFPEESLRDAVAIYRDPADLLGRYADSPLAD